MRMVVRIVQALGDASHTVAIQTPFTQQRLTRRTVNQTILVVINIVVIVVVVATIGRVDHAVATRRATAELRVVMNDQRVRIVNVVGAQ